MRARVIVWSLTAAVIAIGCESASAAPAAAVALKEAATAASGVQPAQYREYRARHHFVKCYRDFVFGPYRCHYYRHHW